ncbi:MAG: hypothetical protein WCG45_02740 [bacterium]
MSSFREDLEKYAALWDNAVKNNVFGDEKKQPEEKTIPNTGYFGNPTEVPEEEMEQFLESKNNKFSKDLAYWTMLVEDICPKKEVIEEEEKEIVHFNPVQKSTFGKDQEPKVSQNWAMGGKEYFKLEELKVKLEKLESELNAFDAKSLEKESGKMQSKIDDLKKEIDDVSDSLTKE